MKKTISITAAVAMIAVMMTACGSEAAPEAQTTVQVPEETTEAVMWEDNDEDVLEDETDIIIDEIHEEGADTEAAPAEDEKSENPLMPYITAAMEGSEWPFMEEMTDEVLLKEFFLIDPANANYQNCIVMQCPMSASMCEIILIRANDVDAAKDDLDARRQKAVDIDAWYPNDKELAEASIVGTSGNYAYFIISEFAENAESKLLDYISSNG